MAFHNIQPIVRAFAAEIVWRPILVGGIFNTVNPTVYASREAPAPAKVRYATKDIQDWAALAGLKIKMPPTVFPVNSVKAMRGCVWLNEQGKLVPFATSAFEIYWGEDRDISQDDVLRDVCARSGVEADAFFAAISEQTYKDALRANTEEAVRRGAFGSPTFYLNETDMYFGNDRLPVLRAALERC